jgi:hypothetical protein
MIRENSLDVNATVAIEQAQRAEKERVAKLEAVKREIQEKLKAHEGE